MNIPLIHNEKKSIKNTWEKIFKSEKKNVKLITEIIGTCKNK